MTRAIDWADVVFVVGLGLVAVGLGAWDWRVACVVVGVILLGVGLAMAWAGHDGTG